MGFYDKDKLLQVAKSRGYGSLGSVATSLSPILGYSRRGTLTKLGTGTFTKEECEVIGSFFEMTMTEYYDVFMNGLFQKNLTGRYVCHINDWNYHMNPPKNEEEVKKPKGRRITTKEERVDELMEALKKL